MLGSVTKAMSKSFKFSTFEVTRQVFLHSDHSFALVNLKPLTPGHVLVCPQKPHRRLTDLSLEETSDLFITVQRVQRLLAKKYFPKPDDITSASFTVAVQDGPQSGQTVPHVHVHVIPRLKTTDIGENSDAVYTKMASEEGNVGGALWDRDQATVLDGQMSKLKISDRPVSGGKMSMIDDLDRQARTDKDMEDEAEVYKRLIDEMRAE